MSPNPNEHTCMVCGGQFIYQHYFFHKSWWVCPPCGEVMKLFQPTPPKPREFRLIDCCWAQKLWIDPGNNSHEKMYYSR